MALEMMTTSLLTTLFPPSSTPPFLHQNRTINSSDQSWLNNSTFTPIQPSGLVMSCVTMIFGIISNLTALGILARSRVKFRHQAKASFLLLTVALLLADLGGHVIPGAFALEMRIKLIYNIKPISKFCNVFGACMVFFGLCPLLFGCAMAVERCVAITQPFFHASMITVAHMWRVVLFLSSLAIVLAVLPFFAVGEYKPQFPDTWCFLPIHKSEPEADTNLALAFSCLGLTALILSLLCNILSSGALLRGRIKSHNAQNKVGARRGSAVSSSSLFFTLDVEVMVQLAMVTVVSCVCWGPFLIHILVVQLNHRHASAGKDGFFILALRIASWNQILDPWVYILLRRTMLSRVCCGRYTQRSTVRSSCSYTRYKASVCNDDVSLEVFSYDQK
ncbi:prostaglandin E receptor 1c (subtype EP1) [Mugil cephalus]|uniref:prostaglandin E receptor 1c (subtype EP1) n=1 Tax=Mugil cephalus TaxID=48193 RepID=UPI001FB79F80|nr:prostaglandin E receptor 1c (subtype EP1) [Mugil cephalus]